VFHKLNLTKGNDFDETAIISHLEKHVTDDEWKKVTKKAFEFCHKTVQDHGEELQKSFKVKKEQCDVRYIVLLDCIDMFFFIVSKTFLTLCILLQII
jgi:hypothetical protein